jgi:choline dehydrogenase-like flavoprotein
VLAERLSADPRVRVLLIEAGPPDNHPFIHMPRALVRILGNDAYTWVYEADPVPGGRNEPHRWVRGKTLGGSSSINGMLYVRGQPRDYDDWAAGGAEGWGWAEMRRAFTAIEGHALGGGPDRGGSGPLHVSLSEGRQPLCDAFIEAAGQRGLPRKVDLNEGDQVGAGYYPRTIRHGRRWSAARAFLRPAMARPNLTVLTGQMVERVVFEGRRAVGVLCAGAGGDRVVHRAGGEVILAAGGLNSPVLLQRSGIGAAGHLRDLGIEVVHDAPDVGENMREHWLLPLEYRLRGAGSTNPQYAGLRLLLNVARAVLLGRGPMTEASYEAGAFLKTQHGLDRADAQLLFGPFTIDRSRFAIDRLPGAQCGGMVLRPESCGSIRIRSADPKAAARIQPNYMTAEYDQQVAIRTYRFIRDLFERAPLADHVQDALLPPASIRNDDEILDAWRRFGVAGYHAACTCRMGDDATAVVDPRLRVRGVAGLRVVDISVMPTLISGNTNAPAMAMAWRAAELILADRAAGMRLAA